MSPSERFNPFPGLRSFEPDEDHLFFGRETQTDELLRRLRTTRFLAVVGTSGSGKSSLVRSGLIPSLHGGAMSGAGSSWRVAILRPGGNPMGNLADALAAPGALGDAPVPPDRSFLAANLLASRLGLVQSVREAGLPSGDRLLVLVDQFEELFRFRQSGEDARDEALAFVRLLLEAARRDAVQIYVALTMRSEYIGHCMQFPDLPEAINAGLYLVPRMTRDQLRSAIDGPVAVGRGQIALSLVLRLLNDVGDDPDQLPVLQHALMRTWDRWESDHAEGEPLDLRHYDAVGTLREALSQHADEAYRDLDSREKEIAEKMFKALTEPGPDGKGVRRPVSLGEVCALAGAREAEVLAVVERFRQPGRSFLTPPAGAVLDAATILDLSHESLIRVWGKLSNWVQEEARDAHEYRDLADVAGRHAKKKADLLRGLNLQVALAWRERARPTPVWAQRYDPNFQRTTSFLAESEKAQQQESAERERQRRSRQRLAWALMIVLTLATAVSSLMWRDAREARLEAEELQKAADAARLDAEAQRTAAEAARLEAEAQKAEAVAARLEAEGRKTEADKARLDAEAQKTAADAARLDAEAQKAEAVAARLEAEGRKTEADQAREEAETQRAAAERAKDEADESARTANQEKSRAERLQRLAEARERAAQSLQQKDFTRAALLAVGAYRLHSESRQGYEKETESYEDKTDFYRALQSALSRWTGPARPGGVRAAKQGPVESHAPVVRRLDTAVRTLAYDTRDGTLIAGTEDGRLRAFSSNGGETRVRPFQSGVRSFALGPAPGTLAAGSLGGSLVVLEWPKYGSRAQIRLERRNEEATGALAPFTALTFHREGWLATGEADGAVHLWKWQGGQAADYRSLRPPTSGDPVTSLVFSKEGRKLAACGKRTILLWEDFATTAAPTVIDQEGKARAVDLSRDGRLLAAGTAGGKVVVWDLSAQEPTGKTSPSRHASAVNSVRWSSDGRLLASAGSDGTVKLWEVELAGGAGRLQDPPLTLFGHSSWVWTTDFSPDGKWLASGSEDRTVRFWPTSLDLLVEDVCQRLRGQKLSSRDRIETVVFCPSPPKRAETSGAMP